MNTNLHATFALPQPTLPLKTAGIVDVLLTFRPNGRPTLPARPRACR